MFLGTRGTNDWVDGQRPKSWRQQILYLLPNGNLPFTAITSMARTEKVDDPEFYWWTQTQSAVQGAVSGIYTTPDLVTAYVNGGVAGDVLYVVVSTTLANRIVTGKSILLRDASDYRVDVVAKVIGVTRGTTTSTLAVRLLEADDNSPTHDLSDCDWFKVIGNVNPEHGEMPEPIALNPVKVYNYTQIWRTSLSMSRTALQTKLRTPEQRAKAKSEALLMHGWEMEQSLIWGIRTENVGDNGKPERTTMGVIPFIRTYASENCLDYTLDTDYSGDTWLTGGETWMKNSLEQIFRYGATKKLCICGSGFLLGIDALASNRSMVVEPGEKFYGMEINQWKTVFGSIDMVTHPLFSYDATTRNMAIILEPSELAIRAIQDTKFFGETNDSSHSEGYGQGRLDGTNEEFLTELGLEFGLPQKCAVLNGVGVDNTLT